MKSIKLTLLILGIAVTGFFSFMDINGGSIKGTVTPPDKASTAWAVSPTDTLQDVIENGIFEITGVKAGTYTIIIESKSPTKIKTKRRRYSRGWKGYRSWRN